MIPQQVDLNAWIRRRLEELPLADLRPVDVAIVDSGVDASHPDLRHRVTGALSVETDDSGVRVVPVEPGINQDPFGHGTAVASIVSRMAPNARIVDIKVLGATRSGSAAALLAGVRHAVQQRYRVINLSLAAKAEHAAALRALCETAYRQNQIVVAARRNMPLTDEGIPAEFPSTISVDRDSFGNPYEIRFHGGRIIEYSALGDEVVVAAAGGGYTTRTGTSFATPAVSAMCALVLGAFPELRPFELKTVLKAFARS